MQHAVAMLPRRWSNLARHGLLAPALVGLAAAPAAADTCGEEADTAVGIVIGVDLSPKPRLVGGVEVRQCISNDSDAFLRLEVGGGNRLIAGARVRPFKDASGDPAWIGLEAGAGLGTHARFAAHVAATYGGHSLYAALQGWLPLASPSPAPEGQPRATLVGALAPFTYIARSTVVEGRPLTHDGRLLRPGFAAPLPFARTAEERAIRDHFASSAQLEASSVWTFLRLAAELAAAGAPAALIAAALDAADDEVRHAEMCARAAGGIALRPLPMIAAQPRFTTRTEHALALLATEAWLEGCLNEGAAAEEARLASNEADGDTRTMLATIAHDETMHAELSWRVLAWLFETAPDVTARTLAALPRSEDLAPAPVDPALARAGVATAEITAAAQAHARTTANARLAAWIR